MAITGQVPTALPICFFESQTALSRVVRSIFRRGLHCTPEDGRTVAQQPSGITRDDRMPSLDSILRGASLRFAGTSPRINQCLQRHKVRGVSLPFRLRWTSRTAGLAPRSGCGSEYTEQVAQHDCCRQGDADTGCNLLPCESHLNPCRTISSSLRLTDCEHIRLAISLVTARRSFPHTLSACQTAIRDRVLPDVHSAGHYSL